ncbi:MAG: matrixin family metalloprotease [Gammaproteobacteria bacterium]|nr:matrixin family metalloprotease [Gammaproteobacteria bacterium]
MSVRTLRGMVLLCLLTVLPSAGAYVFMGSKWPQAQTTFYVSIPGSNGIWNSAFEQAMGAWLPAGFRFLIVRNTYSDPCNSSDHRNGVRFNTNVCGSAFGATTLAITSVFSLGAQTTEADIVFNSKENWDVYAGTLYGYATDFRRVAVHELGHALGLDHENDVPAIMASVVGNIEAPRTDDVTGVKALYGLAGGDDFGNSLGTAHAIAPNSTTNGVIGTGSDVDVFRIRLASRGRMTLRTNGGTDTVGTLYSSTGAVLAANNDGCGNGVNFCLARMLNAGTYYVKVDGFSTTKTGPYSLVARFAVDDFGNTRAEAKLIAPNSTTNGRINSGGDVDYFKIQLT